MPVNVLNAVTQPRRGSLKAAIAAVLLLLAQSWCIAVNPPDDDGFPVILVDGIVIDLMLDPKNEQQSVVWIPGRRRPTFSEPMVVLRNGQVKFVHAETRKARGGGVYSVETRKKTPLELFDGRVPRPAPDTYFLTPTGRLEIEIAEQPGTDRDLVNIVCEKS